MNESRDIGDRGDIKILIDKFYAKVKVDRLLGPVFAHVAWPDHLPIMYDFWSSMLFGEQTYRGNPLQKHLPLNINREHFARWLELFKETVDQNFAGANSDEVKTRADSIAVIFQYKMGLIK